VASVRLIRQLDLHKVIHPIAQDFEIGLKDTEDHVRKLIAGLGLSRYADSRRVIGIKQCIQQYGVEKG